MVDKRYRDYIESPAWAAKREARLKLDRYKCACCGRPMNLQVHHLHYHNFRHEDVRNDLVTLCEFCHKDLEARKHDWNSERDQLVYIFIKKYKKKDSIFGGTENMCDLKTIKKYWAEMCSVLHRTETRSGYVMEIQGWFRDRRIEFIKNNKAAGADVNFFKAKGISPNMINKYFYTEDK